jgi:hypothetical protein
VDELLLVAVVEGAVVLTLLVPLPEELTLLTLLGCVALLPLGDVALLDVAGLTAPVVVLGEVTGPGVPSGWLDSLEHDATSGGRTRHKAAERKVDERILVMGELTTSLES